jgi:hypothetical protein
MRGPLLIGVLWNVGCWLTIAGLAALGGLYLRTHDKDWLLWALLVLGAHVACRIGRYSSGMKVKCPLCHGTPLHANRSRKHRYAVRLGFLGHRASTVLMILFRWTFRCMYCGTPFRLRK